MRTMTWMGSLAASALVVALVRAHGQHVPAPSLPPALDKNLLYLGQPVAASDVTFTISRSTCFGSCPCYTVVVHGDGRVDWDGKYFVAQKGVKHGCIEPEAVQLLLDRAGEMDFFAHAVSFNEAGMDGSNCELTLHIAGQERKADVPHFFMTKEVEGLAVALGTTMRDEVDFTRAVDALTESWRWIHTIEEADHDPRKAGAGLPRIPDGFSIGIRRHPEFKSPQYTVTIDATGAGTWHGDAYVREIGDRAFTVPHVEMLLLASRAQKTVGLGKNLTVDGDGEAGTDLFVHATGLEPSLREHLSSLTDRNSNQEDSGYAKAEALVDLVDVFARTSHFAGSWDEQQGAIPAERPSSK